MYVAEAIGYPVLVRPSYVLGGRNMQVCYDQQAVAEAARDGERVLVDRFLEGAIEIDVDALRRARDVCRRRDGARGGGVHSATPRVLPAPSLDPATLEQIEDTVRRLAPALGVVGLVNVQLGVVDGEVFVIEANSARASRTVRSRARRSGINLVEAASKPLARRPPVRPGPVPGQVSAQVSVKAAVLPFAASPEPTRCSARRCARPAR